MLVGEYAVLDGGPAVVAAVTCYAKAQLLPPFQEPASAFIEAAIAAAKAALKRRGIHGSTGTPFVNTDDFFKQGQKIGLGSSASVVVSSIGAMFHAAGLSLSSSSVRSEIQTIALKAHQKAQGISGSGADIVASTWGGIHVMNSLIQPTHSLPIPFRLVTTQTPASTSELVHRYRHAGDRTQWAAKQMIKAAEFFLTAWQSSRSDLLLFSVETAFEGYVALSEILQFSLITKEHQLIHDLAKEVGGAAKPSGAGGGDIAVAFFPSIEAEKQFLRKLPESIQMLDFTLDELGVHVPS